MMVMMKGISLKCCYLIILISLVIGCASQPASQRPKPELPQLTMEELTDDAMMSEEFVKENLSIVEKKDVVILQKVKKQSAAVKKIENTSLNMHSMNLRYSKKLYDFWINYLTSRFRDTFQNHLGNALKYKDTVMQILARYNLPKELFYVGLIESGYNLRIKSRAGAAGPWQFMKSTAIHYGLKIKRGVDERNDLIKSTHAACRYFKDLYNIFGSWEFALLAYNKGEYGVIRAIRRGNSRDYKVLVAQKLLPRETIYYIPKIVAARDIFNQMDQYGFSGQSRTLATQEVSVQVAKSQTTPRPKVVYKKHLTHKVRKGDTLLGLSQRYAVSLAKIKQSNSLRSNRLLKNQKIKIPVKVSYYTVREGDNLTLVAQKFGLSVGKILSYNSLDSEKIYPRQRLVIPVLL